MASISVGIVLVLCIQFVSFTKGELDTADTLRQGYFQLYDCISECYRDSYQLRYADGHLCSAQSDIDTTSWNYVGFQYVVHAYQCITQKCASQIPQSVCKPSLFANPFDQSAFMDQSNAYSSSSSNSNSKDGGNTGGESASYAQSQSGSFFPNNGESPGGDDDDDCDYYCEDDMTKGDSNKKTKGGKNNNQKNKQDSSATAASKSQAMSQSNDNGQSDSVQNEKQSAESKSQAMSQSNDNGQSDSVQNEKQSAASKSQAMSQSNDNGQSDSVQNEKQSAAISPSGSKNTKFSRNAGALSNKGRETKKSLNQIDMLQAMIKEMFQKYKNKKKPKTTSSSTTTTAGYDSTTTMDYDSSPTTDYDSTTATDYGSTTATDYDSTTATDYGSTTATDYGSTTSTYYDSTTATDYGSTTATYYDSTTATDYGSTTTTDWDLSSTTGTDTTFTTTDCGSTKSTLATSAPQNNMKKKEEKKGKDKVNNKSTSSQTSSHDQNSFGSIPSAGNPSSITNENLYLTKENMGNNWGAQGQNIQGVNSAYNTYPGSYFPPGPGQLPRQQNINWAGSQASSGSETQNTNNFDRYAFRNSYAPFNDIDISHYLQNILNQNKQPSENFAQSSTGQLNLLRPGFGATGGFVPQGPSVVPAGQNFAPQFHFNSIPTGPGRSPPTSFDQTQNRNYGNLNQAYNRQWLRPLKLQNSPSILNNQDQQSQSNAQAQSFAGAYNQGGAQIPTKAVAQSSASSYNQGGQQDAQRSSMGSMGNSNAFSGSNMFPFQLQ